MILVRHIVDTVADTPGGENKQMVNSGVRRVEGALPDGVGVVWETEPWCTVEHL